jgi:hypothetical protein
MTKRLQLLNIDPSSTDKLYLPANASQPPVNTAANAVGTAPAWTSAQAQTPMEGGGRAYDRMWEDDGMEVDSTPTRVYIHNLDAELSSSDDEAPSDRLVFIPDIERKLSKIPQHILTGRTPSPRDGHVSRLIEDGIQEGQLVLYGVPNSLSVPEEKDVVRKAIIETRARAARETSRGRSNTIVERGIGIGGGNEVVGMEPVAEEDEDAMEIEL